MLAFQLQLRINLTTDMQTCNAMEEALVAFQQTSLDVMVPWEQGIFDYSVIMDTHWKVSQYTADEM